MKLIISKDSNELGQKFAEWMIDYIQQVLKKQNRFTIALSGGTTPQKLYQLLASDNFKNKIDWSKLHFFWGDERFVPFNDDRNNAKMAFDTLLNHVPVIREQVHTMRTDIEPEASAKEYEKILQQYFPDKNHSFDLVLLGLGDNAHTLSLFPESNLIHEKEKWVSSVYLKEQNVFRITLTAPVANAAACVAFLVNGKNKAAAVYNVFTQEHQPMLYPAQIIQPFNDELYWWLDEDAASMIK
jgi:6-phosphogluconolactonase